MLRKLSYCFLFLGLVIYVGSCNESANKAKINKAEEKLKERFNKDAIEMALKYNAISNYEDKIRAIDKERGLYSVDIEDNLITKDGRPVLLKGKGVIDIFRIHNKYNVLLFGEIDEERLILRLEATPEQVEAIKNHPDNYKEYAAIIAQISSIRTKWYEDNENEWPALIYSRWAVYRFVVFFGY